MILISASCPIGTWARERAPPAEGPPIPIELPDDGAPIFTGTSTRLIFSTSFLSSRAYLTLTEYRSLPSTVMVWVIPPKADWIISCTSSTFSPYRAISSRLISISRKYPVVTRSA